MHHHHHPTPTGKRKALFPLSQLPLLSTCTALWLSGGMHSHSRWALSPALPCGREHVSSCTGENRSPHWWSGLWLEVPALTLAVCPWAGGLTPKGLGI